MTPRVFTKLLGLFVLLLVFQTALMEFVLRRMSARIVSGQLVTLSYQMLWPSLIALAVAVPLAAWSAWRINVRLDRMVAFARRIAEGDLGARMVLDGEDELDSLSASLNQTAARLGQNFAELESRRQELATMLDSMQEAVVAVTPEGTVRWSNSMLNRITGTHIQPGRQLVHFVRDPDVLACVRGALDQREVRFGRANSLAPGRMFEISAGPLPSGGALLVLHDVTRIEIAEKSRRDFVANVSHELRTPLTSIQGYVETLMEEPRPNAATTHEFLAIILKNATRMNRLTEDLLALAGIESPDYKLTVQPTRASALVQDAIESLGGMVVDSDVVLESAGAPDLCVQADPDAMNQVFGNLIENSLKYASSGKRIRVGAKQLDSEVQFTVQDFGPGIAYEHLGRIFERFYRVDKARSRDSGGTGLGLAIVKHIVQTHGGRIWAESELGFGAQFHFTLPLSPPPVPEKVAPPEIQTGV